MNNQISDSQYGFRNKRSCLKSLLYFYAQVIDTYDMDNNKAVDLVYLDFVYLWRWDLLYFNADLIYLHSVPALQKWIAICIDYVFKEFI